MKKIYTGIGSRETPKHILQVMTDIASYLADRGWTLRSGGAQKADQAFQLGAKKKEIYLPKDGFEGWRVDNKEFFVPEYDEYYPRLYHPKFKSLSADGRLFMSRNTNQILGKDINNPVLTDVVFCWTWNGSDAGGTGQAIRIANDLKIPVLNLKYMPKVVKWFNDVLLVKDFDYLLLDAYL